MTLPKPVKRDKFGWSTSSYDRRKWFEKIMEEVLEAHATTDIQRHVEELVDIITVCISYLDALDFDEEARAELYRRVNEKNERRGYFKELPTEKTETAWID